MKQERSKKGFLNDKNHKQHKKKLNATIRLLEDDTSGGFAAFSRHDKNFTSESTPIQNHQMIP